MSFVDAAIQIIMGGLGTLGFNILFNIRGRKLALATLGGLISWAVFLAIAPIFPSEAVCYFVSAAAVTVYGEIFARVVKTPTTSFLVPSIVPLIPGSALYYTMNYALNKQWADFSSQAFYTLKLAFCLAAGIIAVTTVTRLVWSFTQKHKIKGHHTHHSIK